MFSLFLALGLMFYTLFSPIISYAYIGEGTSKPEDISTWKQWDYPNLSSKRIVPGGNSIGWASCGYWSLLAVMIKNEPAANYSPEDFFKKVYEKQLNDAGWGHFNWTNIKELNEDLSLVDLAELQDPDITLNNGYFYNFNSNLSYNEKIGKLKELVKRGYYVVACFQATQDSGHYIFLDYVDSVSNDIRIFDSGFKGSWLSEFYTNESKELKYFVLLKGSSNTLKKSLYKDSNADNYNKEVEVKNLINKLKETKFVLKDLKLK